MTEQEEAEQALTDWATTNRDRDHRVRRALAAGVSKNRVHTLTGISRSTIDRLLKETDMTVTTTRRGPNGTTELNGWYDFINGGDYTEAQEKELAETLLHEQANEFNALLPDGWTWFPSTSEIILPVERPEEDDDIEMDELLREASEAVQGRFEKIEAGVLAQQS